MLSQMVKVIPVSRTILGRSQFMRLPSVRNYWRRNMFSELSSAMQSVENRMREMDKEMNRLFDDIQRSSPVKLPRIFSPIDWAHTREIPVISKDGDGRVYKVELDMQGMEPEDIKVI
ncbi:SHSP domain-containing protein [Caerostris darwini]|uniref:SHSP domain-containing protein n=1 Tax=Caerostris darwini TaxID=1538125 RepID=A0AAV4N2J8_9ARAC|nr:SHSP domain-containing protein [Caerostris darwini]